MLGSRPRGEAPRFHHNAYDSDCSSDCLTFVTRLAAAAKMLDLFLVVTYEDKEAQTGDVWQELHASSRIGRVTGSCGSERSDEA